MPSRPTFFYCRLLTSCDFVEYIYSAGVPGLRSTHCVWSNFNLAVSHAVDVCETTGSTHACSTTALACTRAGQSTIRIIIGSALLGTPRFNFQSPIPPVRHSVAVLALQNWGCNAPKFLWSRLPIPIRSPSICETFKREVVEETPSFTCKIDILFLSRCN